MMNRFDGRVAVVTGAGEGIGAAIAERILTEGGAVVAVDLREASSIIDPPSDRFLPLLFDVSAKDTPDAVIEAAVDRFGRIDIIVNNAGISQFASIEDLSDELWQRHLDINVTAAMRMSRAALPQLKAFRRGRILNISSISALRAVANHAAYSASKSAVLGLTKALAVEFGAHHITVNAILPGMVMTNMMKQTLADFPEKEAYLTGLSVLNRMATPEEIAGAAAFVASDDGGYFTGQSLIVDGGVSARL